METDTRPRFTYFLPGGTLVRIIFDHSEEPPPTTTYQLVSGAVVVAIRGVCTAYRCGRDHDDACHSLRGDGDFGPGGHDFVDATPENNAAAASDGLCAAAREFVETCEYAEATGNVSKAAMGPMAEKARQELAAAARAFVAACPGVADVVGSDALCTCGHRNGEHCGPGGLGPCDVAVRPGELCACEGFRPVPTPEPRR